MLFNHINLFILLKRSVISKSIITPSSPTPLRKYHRNPVVPLSLSFYSSHRRTHRQTHRNKPKHIPPPDPSQLELSTSQLLPRFTEEDLSKTLNAQPHPLICLHLFNYASYQPRFKHNISTFLITIKKLGSAQLFDEFDYVVNQALAVPIPSSEPLFNTIIYYYTESRKLSKAINIFKHMKKSKDPMSHPSIKTYNLLFSAMLSRGSNSYINHMYMGTIRCLFRQMVNDGIEPDIFSLNSVIKGYVLSLHLNDALRVFHQMGVVYQCLPNEHSYSYIIHGLCAQGRSKNAMQLYREMVIKGFVPSEKAYNSLVNCLAIAGEVKEAIRLLWEMFEKRKLGDFITYQTVLDALGREGKVNDSLDLLREFKEKDLVHGQSYRKLLYFLEDEFGNSNIKNGFEER
ncbi:pentatricopeptide repeat-containing protein At2g27800, mitochondrial-like [Aristolochia californica]|uniref:pentatricopeptide repeat-containing protein At2g27800, mitochondrial-like n=1 Tax=Aristolochia californica TaxID=171875 RepID=UPI0035DF5CB2